MTDAVLKVSNIGLGNEILVSDGARCIDSEVVVRGNGNSLRLSDGCVLNKASILIDGNENEIFFDRSVSFSGRIIIKLSAGNSLSIGAGTTVGGANIICGESTSIRIGKACMLSWGIEIRSTDSHGIYDLGSGHRVNEASRIEIGDRVWIGAHATVLSGASIGNDSVVGIRAVVAGGDFEGNSVLVGVPARVVRRGIRWERELLG